ncbi:hypothetical protein T08_8087 [Trichinella sp. T8]|nr:hypothetical protein T08_8087 [Trichinella sp. T8]
MAYYNQSSDALAEWLAVVPTVPWPWRTRHRWNSRSFPEASPLHSGNRRSRSNATSCSYDFIVWYAGLDHRSARADIALPSGIYKEKTK